MSEKSLFRGLIARRRPEGSVGRYASNCRKVIGGRKLSLETDCQINSAFYRSELLVNGQPCEEL